MVTLYVQVLQVVHSHVETRAGPAVGIYMVMAHEYMEHFLQPGVEKEVKAAIRNAGGSYNQSGFFPGKHQQ